MIGIGSPILTCRSHIEIIAISAIKDIPIAAQADSLGDPASRATRQTVNTVVTDAGIAIKWVVEEEGTPQSLMLLRRAKLMAPELLATSLAKAAGEL